MNNQAVLSAAELLINARKTGNLLSALPEELIPETIEDAYRVQDAMAQEFGPIGGWKIGALSQDSVPFFAPMPEAWIQKPNTVVSGPQWRFRAIEAEAAFLLGHDLPVRTEPYTRAEVVQAVASCHPAVELLETGLDTLAHSSKLSTFADMQLHGGFVFGKAAANWESINFPTEHVTVSVDGKVHVDRTGSNTAVDLIRLLVWLANEGAARTGGLRAGQWITTGSWTGNTPLKAGEPAEIVFNNLGRVGIEFQA